MQKVSYISNEIFSKVALRRSSILRNQKWMPVKGEIWPMTSKECRLKQKYCKELHLFTPRWHFFSCCFLPGVPWCGHGLEGREHPWREIQQCTRHVWHCRARGLGLNPRLDEKMPEDVVSVQGAMCNSHGKFIAKFDWGWCVWWGGNDSFEGGR